MKKIFKYLMLGAVVIGASSCEKYLDINKNPNNFTSATPAVVLPQAIVGAASISNSFNIGFADFSGARANAGGFGGFGSVVTYDFGTADYAGLWSASYDNANDFQYVINETSGDIKLAYSTGIARIMKSFAFERLVNQFNDVPYTDALKSTASLQPKYDKAEDVYKACIAELTKAITDITTAQASATTNKIVANTDPMFAGDMELWKKFANTVKLRMLIKMAGVPAHQAYATSQFAAMNLTVGFLANDAVVQPGYVKTDRPNPTWASLGFSGTNTNITTSRIPTKWMYSFYNGTKLADVGRAKAIYRGYPSTIINQLGDESASVPAASSAGSAWTTAISTTTASVIGVAKSPSQAAPVLLATESNFLQAEAFARGYLAGDAAVAFNNGILASFNYLYKADNGTVDPAKVAAWQISDGQGGTKPDPARSVAGDVTTYKNANALSRLVNWSLATTLPEKIEAIITQKYIALNMIANDENFNEFRRTGYPFIVNGSSDPILTFASKQSVSTHVDKLPTRVLYPQEEYNLNPANAPKGINKFSSLIFWDLN
ncbi:MAG: SusD/RagB family nutrient-binding outer membrane lipoprotein [Pedobacter sp.]|nr:MAG: SusD/RagB family nutrient-binding outer membrane lipoprotein [Pedobacter sp.]